MNEFEIKRAYINHIYSRDSKMHSDKVFVRIGNGEQGELIGLPFIKKITNHCISTPVVKNIITLFLTNYLN